MYKRFKWILSLFVFMSYSSLFGAVDLKSATFNYEVDLFSKSKFSGLIYLYYNSKNTSKSIFGEGWDSSLDLSLDNNKLVRGTKVVCRIKQTHCLGDEVNWAFKKTTFGEVKLVTGTGKEYFFRRSGKLKKIKFQGHQVELNYKKDTLDSLVFDKTNKSKVFIKNGFIIKVSSTSGSNIAFKYSGDLLTSIGSKKLSNHSFNYNLKNNMQVASSDGEYTRIKYDRFSNVEKVSDKKGHRLFTFRKKDNELKIVENRKSAFGNFKINYSFQYHNSNLKKKTVKIKNNIETFYYNNHGQVLKYQNGNKTIHYKYDELNRLTEKRSKENIQEYNYLKDTFKLRNYNKNGIVISFSWNKKNKLSTINHPVGKFVITYARDSKIKKIRCKTKEGKILTWSVNKSDRLVSKNKYLEPIKVIEIINLSGANVLYLKG